MSTITLDRAFSQTELSPDTSSLAFAEQTVWNGGCTSYYKLGSKIIATFPGTTTEFWWRTREPKWTDYHQEGGTARVAARKQVGKLLKLVPVLVALLAVRRLGWKRVKTEILIFLLVSAAVSCCLGDR